MDENTANVWQFKSGTIVPFTRNDWFAIVLDGGTRLGCAWDRSLGAYVWYQL